MKESVSPGHDFYQFVNGNWKPDSSASEQSVNTIMKADVFSKLRMRLNDSLADDGFGSLRAFYQSIISAHREKSLNSLGKEIQQLHSVPELPGMMAWLTKRGYRSPLELKFGFNDTLNIVPGRSGFTKYFDLDRGYYDSLETIMKNVLPLVGIAWNDQQTAEVASLQRKLKDSIFVGTMDKDSLPELVQTFIGSLQLPDDVHPDINLTYDFIDFLDSVSVPLWKDYFTWSVVEENIHFLTDSIARAYNARVENFTARNITNYNSADRAILLLIDLMPDEMIRLYGFSESRHQAILSMAEHIRNVMVETVQSNESIDTAARNHLMDQLKSINLNCAIPGEFFSYEDLFIDEFDVLGNIRRAEEFNYMRWVESASSGNLHNRQYLESLDDSPAFYYEWNSVLLPISFSEIPLFSETYDDAYNYGALGFYVGHEIAHSFHSKPDLVTDILSDSVEEAIINQYGSYRTYSGDTLNSRLTRFENFTDIVGLNAALNAYKQVPSYKKTLNGRTGPQRFFMAFANSQRQYFSPERTEYLIKYDEHTISYLRVNGTVRNLDDFYEAFNVQPGDSLYLPEDERLHLW